MFRTELATKDELKNWNQIIARCAYSEALHTIEWRNALMTNFRQMKPIYFVTKNGEDIVGVLPCFIFQPIPLSKAMLSMPWTLSGGLLAFVDTDIKAISNSVCQKLDEIAHKRHISETIFTLLDNHESNFIDSLTQKDYIQKDRYFTHILSIDDGFDAVWERYNKRVRGAVRKAEKNGVIVRETSDEADMIKFYRTYLSMMKNFGSTPKPYSLLRYLQTSSIAKLVIAELDGNFIAGLLFLYFNSHVRLWCETSDPNFLSYRPNNAVINYIIKWSCENKYNIVDFGASPLDNEGLASFKEEWGAKKAWLSTFIKVHSTWRKRLWTVSEPSIRRIYAAIQHFKLQ
jgi:hypothetical protein